MQLIVCGIDPDVAKSGFAVLEDGEMTLSNNAIWNLFDTLKEYKQYCADRGIDLIVRLEAGWFIKARSFHSGGKGSAYDVGRNHEIGKQIEMFCKEHGINVQLVKPCGYSQVTHEKFCAFTGWDRKNKTNSETRVAGMLAFAGAGKMKKAG